MIRNISTLAALATPALLGLSSVAQAGSITLDGITTPLAINGEVTVAPDPVASKIGTLVAAGLEWSGGANLDTGSSTGLTDNFLAWCFDLVNPVGLGLQYAYEVVSEPFSNSYLLDGAGSRVSRLINGAYDTLDTSDPLETAAFQLSVWEVAYDDDFDIMAGEFQAGGVGVNAQEVTDLAQGFLSDAESFDGVFAWDAVFLETRETPGSQNLVTAVRGQADIPEPVPVPAAGFLLLGGLALLRGLRRRAA